MSPHKAFFVIHRKERLKTVVRRILRSNNQTRKTTAHIQTDMLVAVKCGPRQLSRYSDSLRAGRSGDRIPEGARFPAAVQTGPGAYPASCTVGTGSLPGVKRPGRVVDHPPPSSAEVK